MKDKILDAAEQMVQDRGLNAVSFQQLADTVGLSKPSVFHHFRNKEALAQALIGRCVCKYTPQYSAIIESDSDAASKLRGIAQVFADHLAQDRLCLLGVMGNSVSTLTEPAREDLRRTAVDSIALYTRVFTQGRAEGSLDFAGSPEDAATAFLALLQGLQTLARAKGDLGIFQRASESYIASISVE